MNKLISSSFFLFFLFIMLSFHVYLQLTYLPPPWGDCRSEPMDSDFFTTYSITACRIDCETRYLVENCNCRMVHMPGENITFIYHYSKSQMQIMLHFGAILASTIHLNLADRI